MPGARLSFLSSAYAAPVLAHHPDLDEVLTVTGQERLGEVVRLFKQNVDAAIFLKPFRRIVTAAWLARVPLRVGAGDRWYSFLLNRRGLQNPRHFLRPTGTLTLWVARVAGTFPRRS